MAKTLPKCLTPGNPGNSGGKPGRSGRKSLDFYAQCQGALDRDVLPKVIQLVHEQQPAKGAKPNAAWWAAAQFLGKYGRSPALPQLHLTPEAGRVTVTLDLGE